MKQSKGLHYFLFVLVSVIWGAIGYQVWKYFSPEQDEMFYTNQSSQVLLPDAINDTFSLSLDYPDPFTGTLVSTRQPSRSNRNNTPQRTPSTKVEQQPAQESQKVVIAPKVEYLGYSINNNQVTRVRLRVDGKSVTYQLHEQKGGLSLVQMSRDSVVLMRADERFVFYRKG